MSTLREGIGSVLYDVVAKDGERYTTDDYEYFINEIMKLFKRQMLDLLGYDDSIDIPVIDGSPTNRDNAIRNELRAQLRQEVEKL